MPSLLPVAYAGGVEIHVPRDAVLSLFSSPYAPHLRCAAIDVSTSPDFGSEAPSPVEGVVDKVIEVDAGPGPYSRVDYIISLRPRRGGRRRVKVMHVKPDVRKGDEVRVGDPLGTYIRTNYFSYHHLPHMHVEVCSDSSLRPLKALPLAVRLPLEAGATAPLSSRLKLRVGVVRRVFILCSPASNRPVHAITLNGAHTVVNGVLENHAPLPYLGLIPLGGGLHIDGPRVDLLGVPGYVIKRFGGAAIITPYRMSYRRWFTLKQLSLIGSYEEGNPRHRWVTVCSPDLEVRGVELFAGLSYPLKLIPAHPLSDDELERLARRRVVELVFARPRGRVGLRAGRRLGAPSGSTLS